MAKQFNFFTSTAKYFVNRSGEKVRIYARDGGGPYPVHVARQTSEDTWSMHSLSRDGYSHQAGCPTPYDIVGEWVDIHESWNVGTIIEVRDRADDEWLLRRFVRYDINIPSGPYVCFFDGDTTKTRGWGYARPPALESTYYHEKESC